MSNSKGENINFHFELALFDKGLSVPSPKYSYLLMHPSAMKSLKCCKGSYMLMHTENGQLLFRCWPCVSIKPSTIMLPSVNLFQYYVTGSFMLCPYPLFISPIDMIVLTCEHPKPFMKKESFKTFLKNQLDPIYLREGLELNISYLGYSSVFLVKKIVSLDVDQVICEENLNDICTSISSLNISGDYLETSIDEASFICSTPISSKQSSSDNRRKKHVLGNKNDKIQKTEQFYTLYSKTKIVLQNSRLENVSSSKQLTLEQLCGLEKQINEVKLYVQALLSQESLCKPQSHGIIFIGASGSGKSALIHAVQHKFNLPVFKFNSYHSERNDEYKHELRKLFNEVADNSPSILLLDGIDEFSNAKQEPNFVQFLSNMVYECLRSSSNVLIIGTTHDISAVDASLRKPGTLEKEIYFDIPSVSIRKKILDNMLGNKHHNLTDKQIKEISEMTHGFTGGDLKLLCDKADISSCERKCDANAYITFEDLKKSLQNMKPSSMTEFVLEKPNVKWSDIGGMHAVKTAITEMVDWPLNHAEQFKAFGITPSRGILMYGPPGCSKTMIAKALVSESHLNFISIKGPQLFNKYVGESEKAVSELFKKARSAAPCVLFFDEIDSLASVRGSTSGNSNVGERILTQLLVEIDGIDVLQGVSIIAATNRPDMIDPSFLRPGRFDQMIYVPLPDSETRKEIFEAKLKNMPHSPDINIAHLVEITEGYTGAEITDVCREAAMSVIKDYISVKSSVITMNHFLTALKSVVPRTSKETIQFFENYNKKSF